MKILAPRSVFLLASILFAAVPATHAQDQSIWRFWEQQDGLKETFTNSLSLDREGRIWAVHGEVDKASRLDGYGVELFPMPDRGRIFTSKQGEVWSKTAKEFRRLEDGKWVAHSIPQVTGSDILAAIPVAKERVLVLLKDKILSYDAANGSVTILKSIEQSSLGQFVGIIPSMDGGIWVTGTLGIAKLSQIAAQVPRWEEHLPSGLAISDLREPSESGRGVITLVGTDVASKNPRVVRFDRGKWTVIYKEPSPLSLRA